MKKIERLKKRKIYCDVGGLRKSLMRKNLKEI